MVPPRRIELRIDPYHGSVIPLNYGGSFFKRVKLYIYKANYSTTSPNKS